MEGARLLYGGQRYDPQYLHNTPLTLKKENLVMLRQTMKLDQDVGVAPEFGESYPRSVLVFEIVNIENG